MPTLFGFLEEYNPLMTNKNQVGLRKYPRINVLLMEKHQQALTKFATRFELALSNTVPLVLVASENIFVLEDVSKYITN
jgi:hypothetical protein